VTTGSDDVLEALAPLSEMSAAGGSVIEEPDRDDGGATFVPPDESERASIISSLGPTPVEIGDTIRHTTLPASAVYLVLLELDLAGGSLHRDPGGLVSIAMAD
jgi:DNA processing protein